MTGAIGPGEWVECIAAHGDDRLAVGQVYQVAEMSPFGWCIHCGTEGEGIFLAGVPRRLDWCDDALCPSCELRPLYRPSESLLRDLLQPIPADLEVA